MKRNVGYYGFEIALSIRLVDVEWVELVHAALAALAHPEGAAPPRDSRASGGRSAGADRTGPPRPLAGLARRFSPRSRAVPHLASRASPPS